MEINDITGMIIQESIEIHRELGQCQVVVPITYQGHRFEKVFRMDMLVEKAVVVELKSIERVPPVDFKRVQTYLRLTRYQVALLINFGEARLKDGLHRIVNKYEGPPLS
jgi:iron complex transport system substrate-binding protein